MSSATAYSPGPMVLWKAVSSAVDRWPRDSHLGAVDVHTRQQGSTHHHPHCVGSLSRARGAWDTALPWVAPHITHRALPLASSYVLYRVSAPSSIVLRATRRGPGHGGQNTGCSQRRSRSAPGGRSATGRTMGQGGSAVRTLEDLAEELQRDRGPGRVGLQPEVVVLCESVRTSAASYGVAELCRIARVFAKLSACNKVLHKNPTAPGRGIVHRISGRVLELGVRDVEGRHAV